MKRRPLQEDLQMLEIRLNNELLGIVRRINAVRGRALLVGGHLRDALLGVDSKDHDFEVFGLELEALEQVLREFGEVIRVGRSFGVLRVKGLDVDFSLPRRDSKTGRGHRGFMVELDPELSYSDAARRRDLTINSMALDPLTGELLDPHGGRRDLERRVLRATDPRHFTDDPLRGLRVAQFAARFEMLNRPGSPGRREVPWVSRREDTGARRHDRDRRTIWHDGATPQNSGSE